MFIDFMRMDIGKLSEKSKDEYVDEIERIVANGVFNYRVNEMRNSYRNSDLLTLVKKYFESVSTVERKIIEEIVEEREDEINKIPDKFYRLVLMYLMPEFREAKTSIMEMVEELKKSIKELIKTVDGMQDTIRKLTPPLPPPEFAPAFSEAQISQIDEPTKGYAKMCFRAGVWRLIWGDPADYGINVESEIRFVDNFSHPEFREMLKKYYKNLFDNFMTKK